MHNPTGLKTKKTVNTLSDAIIAQIKSRDQLTKALPSGGSQLAVVRQQRSRRAAFIRGHFKVLKGGLHAA
jgi:hypothetical protein